MDDPRLKNIRIVLVETSHPGNIGGAARAMKNMGLSKLWLVNPKQFPHGDASVRAAGADNLLAEARVVDTLAEAVGDCVLTVGTSARPRRLSLGTMDPAGAATELLSLASNHPVAAVFGRENSGLSNEELDLCQLLLHIPVAADFSSLNLAAAVQVLSYELRNQGLRSNHPNTYTDHLPAPTIELEQLYRHMEKTLTDLSFLNPQNPRLLMRRLRRLLSRAQPDSEEVAIMRGMLSAVDRTGQKPD
ncbi:MAG: RNA methyltransferase [Gammaproteobacteria bacterium]|nr:RNA methyltransferase [Gammaproteobacteria bacterium]